MILLCGFEKWKLGIRFTAEARDSPLLHSVPTGSGVYASFAIGYRGSFSPESSVEVKNSWSYTFASLPHLHCLLLK
jgi:hypothetical protein